METITSDIVVKNLKEGNITYVNKDGVFLVNMDEFLKLSYEEILETLNRNPDKILEMAKNSKTLKWVNDFAIAEIVKKLKCKLYESYRVIEELEQHTMLIKQPTENIGSDTASPKRIGDTFIKDFMQI